jgi:hypothetical protein
MALVPRLWVEKYRLDIPVLKVTRQTHAVVCKMRFFAEHDDIVLLTLRVELQQVFTEGVIIS